MKKFFFNQKDTQKLVKNEFLTEEEMQKFVGGRYSDTFYAESVFSNFSNAYVNKANN